MLPRFIDYLPNVTLIRDQGPPPHGGCGGISSLHVLDILMERLAPYTPDLSAGFLHYVYNDSMGFHGPRDANGKPVGIRRNPRVKKHGLSQTQVLKEYGCCPEASFATNYDPPSCEFPNEPSPSGTNFTEALNYRIASYREEHPKTIEDLKKLLAEKGPLVMVEASDQHVVALIGYDDNTSMIRYLNSQPVTPAQSIDQQDYSYFLDRLKNHKAYVVWMTVIPPPRPAPFTARIRISHLWGRCYLLVSIGIDDLPPVIVWNQNCHQNVFDTQHNLTIDVPLPPYAAQHWPPDVKNLWYAEVVDQSPPNAPDPVGTVESVALVERRFDSKGVCTPTLHQPMYGWSHPIPRGRTLRVYFPFRQTAKITLTADTATVKPGGLVKLTTTGILETAFTNLNIGSAPLSGKRIDLYEVLSDPLEGSVRTPIAHGDTASNGQWTYTWKPARTAEYQAIASEYDQTVLALSPSIKVFV